MQRNIEFLADEYRKFRDKFKQGSATITAGNTFVDVTHSLNKATNRVIVTPIADPGGRVWVSNKTANAMRINISAAAGGNIPFDWIVRGD